VRAQRSRWERVTEREEFVGRLSLVDRFPQYLITYSPVSAEFLSGEIQRCLLEQS
jgi:hypothetical protein